MQTRIKTILMASVTLLTLTITNFTANAQGRHSRGGYESSGDNYGRSSCNISERRGGSDRYDRGRRHDSGYRTTCRAIHTCYVVRGCDRYKETTYLHTKSDCYGRVVSRWKTKKSVRVGRAH
ncbi:MAG: hypothetical protein ACI9R3_001395 [Verrucomicrobiales bacterium]|jgi:hypothetical protein